MKLSVVVVNHRSGHRLRQCVESLLAHAPSAPWEVVVVDSGSPDGSHHFLRTQASPVVRLLERGNIGYAAAFNLGFRQTTGELVLSLNSDMVALPGALDAMVGHMDADPRLGAIGGHCVRTDGSFEWRYVRRFPTPWLAYVSTFWPAEKAAARAKYRHFTMLDEDFSRPIEVPQPAGGCLLVRRSLFTDAPVSDRLANFWSDVAIARRVHDAGGRIMVFPDARFVHDHAEAPPGQPTPWTMRNDFHVGGVRYFRLFEGRGAAAAAKALFTYGLAKRLAWKVREAARGRAPAEEARGQARLILDVLRDRNTFLAGQGLGRRDP